AHAGRDTVNDERGSDLLTKTASVAMSDAVSLAYDKRSGVGPLRNLARSVRAVVLVFWLLVRNATSGGGAGPALNAAAIGVGASLVAVSLFTKAGLPVWLENAAWTVLVAALLIAFIRSVTILGLVVISA